MFPKFLKIAPTKWYKGTVDWINETHPVEGVFLYNTDKTILDMHTNILGFSYEIVLPPEQEIGRRLSNGSWTGALGMLQRREVDMVFGDINIDEEKNKEFRLSYPCNVEETTFMTKKPQPASAMAYFLHPFSIQVWLAIITCIFVMSFIFHRLLRRKHSIVRHFISTLGSLVGQGMGVTLQSRRDYFVLASWIVSSALLYYFYAAVLLSFLTFPPLHGVQTIKDLAERIKDGEYQCSTYPNSFSIPQHLKLSKNPNVRAIVSNLHPDGYINPIEYMETSAGDKKPSFISVRPDFVPYKDIYFISEENFYVGTSTNSATRKEFCCGAALDEVVHRFYALGILKRLPSQISLYYFVKNRERFGKQWEDPPAVRKLTMTHLKGPFIFLIASHSLSFLVFLMEVITDKFKSPGCCKNLNLKKKKSCALTSDVVQVAKDKISVLNRPRVTK